MRRILTTSTPAVRLLIAAFIFSALVFEFSHTDAGSASGFASHVGVHAGLMPAAEALAPETPRAHWAHPVQVLVPFRENPEVVTPPPNA